MIADVKANIVQYMGNKTANSTLNKNELKEKLTCVTNQLKITKKKLKDMDEKFAGINLTRAFIQRLKIYREKIHDSKTQDIIEYILKVSCLLSFLYCVF